MCTESRKLNHKRFYENVLNTSPVSKHFLYASVVLNMIIYLLTIITQQRPRKRVFHMPQTLYRVRPVAKQPIRRPNPENTPIAIPKYIANVAAMVLENSIVCV